MLDFTTGMYKRMCKAIVETNYNNLTIADYIQKQTDNSIIMRHDVDRTPMTALQLAEIEHAFGLKSTYYFRYNKAVFNKKIIREIYGMGHEIGYHYEVLSKARGDYGRAALIFRTELNEFRKIVPVSTVSMHGSPLSRWNNLDIWNSFQIEEFGLLGEAYCHIDYNRMKYLTDTGRTWHGTKFNVRDKVNAQFAIDEIESTEQLISRLMSHSYKNVCLLTHPNRWTNGPLKWGISSVSDFALNLMKIVLIGMRK